MVGRRLNFVTKCHDKTSWQVGEQILWENVAIKQHGR